MTLHSFPSEAPLKNDKKANAQTHKDKKKKEKEREGDHSNNSLEPQKQVDAQ